MTARPPDPPKLLVVADVEAWRRRLEKLVRALAESEPDPR